VPPESATYVEYRVNGRHPISTYIGLHRIRSPDLLTPEQLGQIHTNASRTQGAICTRSWIAEDAKTLYCLIEADSRDFAQRLHSHDWGFEHLETRLVKDIHIAIPSTDT
jgi:hypothetical protein